MSWNNSACTCVFILIGHPPREDVSWNSYVPDQIIRNITSSSSWGCELKYKCLLTPLTHARHPPREDVSWNNCSNLSNLFTSLVILLVRMWVEMPLICFVHIKTKGHPPREDVSWNKDEKGSWRIGNSHPPREDVSWNATLPVIRSDSSGHPPREDVSWNVMYIFC